MKQASKKGESNIAWFRLAELISRGEKEKALSLYRLLSHSFENKAYSLQLEADILRAFDENGVAVEKYRQAAYLYKKERQFAAAIAVYEHLLTLHPHDYGYIANLLEFYIRLDWLEKFQDRFNVLSGLFESKKISEEQMLKTIESTVAVFRKQKDDKETKKECSFKQFLVQLKKKHSNLVAFAQDLYDKSDDTSSNLKC